jgi:ABC-type transporter Mla subunit MlaD
MSRQAQVGLFTLIGIIGMLAVAYEITNIGARASTTDSPVTGH